MLAHAAGGQAGGRTRGGALCNLLSPGLCSLATVLVLAQGKCEKSEHKAQRAATAVVALPKAEACGGHALVWPASALGLAAEHAARALPRRRLAVDERVLPVHAQLQQHRSAGS